MKRPLLYLLLALAPSPYSRAQSAYIPLNNWRGELLQPGYGAFYTKLQLKGFKKAARTRNVTTNVFIHLHDERSKRTYVLSQPVVEESRETLIWKIPAGNYLIAKASFNDNSGRVRTWLSAGRPMIGIRSLFLSNLGLLTFEPLGLRGLRSTFTPQLNTYINTMQHDAFAGVIDAYTTKVQESLGGSGLFLDAAKDYGSNQQMRAAFSQQRQIAMFYKVDMVNQDRFAPQISSTVAAQDLDLRRCYMDELDLDPRIQGNVLFNFHIAASDGTMRKIFYRGGSIKSPRLIQCLYYTLGRMQFPLSKALQGSITFYFSYR